MLFTLTVNRPGQPFSHELQMFLDTGALREVTLKVRGQAAPAPPRAATFFGW